MFLPLGLAVALRPAQAETTVWTAITAAPFTINAPGIYCLTQDIATNLASGNAITIDTNNVVLDLMPHASVTRPHPGLRGAAPSGPRASYTALPGRSFAAAPPARRANTASAEARRLGTAPAGICPR